MSNVGSEFLKLKRNRLVLLLLAAAAFSPVLVPLLISTGGDGFGRLSWIQYLLQSQLPIYLATLFMTVILSSIVFAGEYQYRTINVLFASARSRPWVVVSKLITITLLVTTAVLCAGIVNTLLGFGIAGDDPASIRKYFGIVFLSALFYVALVPAAVLLSIVLKKAALASLLYIAFVVVTFPFFDQAEFLPPLLPMHLAIRLISGGSNPTATAMFSSSLDIRQASVSLVLFFSVPLIVVFFYVRRKNVYS